MLYEEWKSRYKNLKNFNTVLQRCPRFWPLAPPRGMNPGVYSLGISEDPPRYLSSKFDASVRSDCWDISIWKTLTQCDGNGNANANANANANENANANANANVDDRGDYNSSPCTSYRRAKKGPEKGKYLLFRHHYHHHHHHHHHHHIIIIRFLISMQVQGQHPHQWAPFQVAGLLHAWQISHKISRCIFHDGQ